MINISSRKKKLPDSISSLLFTMFVIGSFLLLLTYSDSLTNANDISHLYNIPAYSTYDEFSVQKYTWKCQNDKCVKSLLDNDDEVSLHTCNMLCSQPAIWPKPAQIQITNKASSIIDKTKISFDFSGQGPVKIMLQNTTDLFVKNLESVKPGNQSTPGSELNIRIILLETNTAKIKLNTSESYQITVEKKNGLNATVVADNYFGARHGLETLSQLIWYDEVIDELRMLHDVNITDYPKFAYRGLMIDTARNYFPISLIKKVIDGMAMAKLNVLHLHITDSVSFPIVLPKVPVLASFGAYGPDMIYTPGDIKDLVQYARTRGVRILLEVDAPGHVNAGWNFARNSKNEKYVICGEDDITNGHLNPDNDDTLQILEDIYSDLLDLKDDNEIFHIGGDEVNLSCWQNTDALRRSNSRISLKTFWAYYTNKMLDSLKIANNDTLPDHVIMWSSPLTESSSDLAKLNLKVTIQFWLGNPRSILDQGYKIIYSTVDNWYLDCGFGPWRSTMTNGVCDPYRSWQKFYNYRPWVQHGHSELVLGGEVCLWTEQVGVDSLETRIWPRTAAFAERIWSDLPVTEDDDVSTRLVFFIDRLKSRGLKSAAIWPRWCSQNPGKC